MYRSHERPGGVTCNPTKITVIIGRSWKSVVLNLIQTWCCPGRISWGSGRMPTTMRQDFLAIAEKALDLLLRRIARLFYLQVNTQGRWFEKNNPQRISSCCCAPKRHP